MRKSSNTYLIYNKWLLSAVRLIDKVFPFFLFRKKGHPKRSKTPKKILICNLAHLGDVVIATSVLPVLHEVFPGCKTSFLVGSWSKQVIENHKLIDKVFFYDHWKLNRSKISLLKKVFFSFLSKKRAMKNIKKQKFDVAIDLYPYFPNSIHLLWKTKIPKRIGFTSAGFGAYLTDPVLWQDKNQYFSYCYKDLLKQLGIQDAYLKYLKPILTYTKKEQAPKAILKLIKNNFVIFHPFSGDEKKDWSFEKWHKLTKLCLKKNIQVVFTGQGKEQKKEIENFCISKTHCINLANDLSWQELIALLKQAKLIVSIDTVISHMAYSFDLPTIVLMKQSHFSRWLPPGNIGIKSKIMPCETCYSYCDQLHCMQKISPQDVMDQISKKLS